MIDKLDRWLDGWPMYWAVVGACCAILALGIALRLVGY